MNYSCRVYITSTYNTIQYYTVNYLASLIITIIIVFSLLFFGYPNSVIVFIIAIDSPAAFTQHMKFLPRICILLIVAIIIITPRGSISLLRLCRCCFFRQDLVASFTRMKIRHSQPIQESDSDLCPKFFRPWPST